MSDALKEKIIEYLGKVDQARTKDMASAMNEKKTDVDRAVKELVQAGIAEFPYIGTSYVKLVR